MSDSPAHRAIDAVWRIEAPRVIARLARMVGDVGLAEDFAHDALVAALEQWPVSGVPDNPGAWLVAAGKRRAIDHLRRGEMLERKHEQWKAGMEDREDPASALADALDDEIGDDLLRLIFTA
ncbi:MAG: RNA polymerase subunit sigma-24, partial [Gemmatimonadota bacterium]|nr:RNA polymerase subunit sigma-24 [Gemmatimonadota bacterium]